MSISLAFHIVGIVMWVGGLMIVTRVLRGFSAAYDPASTFVAIVRRLAYGFILPGFLVTAVSGVYQIAVLGPAAIMKQGWFHTKLTLVVLLVVVTVATFLEISKLTRGAVLRPGKVAALHGISSLLLILIVFVTMLSVR